VILDILVFALGFMVAGLMALAALPAVWRRALRLSDERLSRLVPLSPEEIAAERDHLRAAHAVALRRVEQALEASEADRAALRIQAARREARIASLDDSFVRAQVRIAELEAEEADLRGEVAALWADHGAEAIVLDGLSRLAERRLEEVAELQAERDALRQEVDRHRTSLAGLETRLMGVETRGGDLERELAEARRDATATMARLTGERDVAAKDHAREIEGLRAELAFMAEQAHSAERRAADSAKAHDALRAEQGEAAPALAELRDDAALRAAIAALADAVLRSAPADAAVDPTA
jgi:chromosome segregation ATPase